MRDQSTFNRESPALDVESVPGTFLVDPPWRFSDGRPSRYILEKRRQRRARHLATVLLAIVVVAIGVFFVALGFAR